MPRRGPAEQQPLVPLAKEMLPARADLAAGATNRGHGTETHRADALVWIASPGAQEETSVSRVSSVWRVVRSSSTAWRGSGLAK
jgi:hypothetical protein